MERLKSHFQKHAMHYVAILLFYALASALLAKSFDGYVVRQGDHQNWVGMSKEVHDAQALFGEPLGWTNSMFGGMPTTHITGGAKSIQVVRQSKRLINSFAGYSGISIFWMAMIGGYILAFALGASPWIAVLCGIGVGLSSFEVLYYSAGHITKVQAIAYMPFILAGVVWAYRGHLYRGIALAAFATALHVSCGHPQMTYYLLFLLVAIGLGESWRMGVQEKDWSNMLRTNAMILLAGSIGVMPHYTHLKETQVYAQHTIRGEKILENADAIEATTGLDRDYILEYSMADGEWLSIMCPDIKGGNNPLYWGEQTFSGGAFYFGAILVALFFMFLVAGKDRLRWPLLVITLLSIALSRRGGGMTMDFFLDYVPAFSKFRDTKMMLVLVLMTVSMGAALGLKELLAESSQQGGVSSNRRWLWLGSLMGLALLFLGFYGAPELFFDFQSSIRPDVAVEQLGYQEALTRRLEVFRADVLRTLGLLVLLSGVVAALVWNKLKPAVAFAVLIAITCADLWNVNRRYFNDDKVNGIHRNWVKAVDHAFPFTPEPQMLKLLAQDFNANPENEQRANELYDSYLERFEGTRLTRDEKDRLKSASQFGAMRFSSPYRVLRWDNPFTDASVSYFFQSIGGYHAAKLRRYQDFIDQVLLPERTRFAEKIQSGATQEAFASLIGHKMLNTRYILFGQMAEPVAMSGTPGFAWVARDWTWAMSDDEEMAKTSALDAPDEAVVHADYQALFEGISPGATGSIDLVNYTPEYVEYSSNLTSEGLGIFSEIWYPEGWIARIDGEPVETLRANYVLRALKIPAGEHTITWEYALESSTWIGVLFDLLLLLFVLGAGWRGWKESNERKQVQDGRA
ncbi:MAG: hypothetical protein CL828_06770 [Crocinitomicaceae bacterium]|nr:hypothetical protein [Crocinitomicaceae bacterium]